MEDLWPRDIEISSTKLKVPAAILKAQGSLLGEKTDNIVVGRVRRTSPPLGLEAENTLFYEFLIVGTVLGYSYSLFEITHSIAFYPVIFTALDNDIQKELELAPGNLPKPVSEEDFKHWLRKILNTQKLKDLVSAILAQSSAM